MLQKIKNKQKDALPAAAQFESEKAAVEFPDVDKLCREAVD